MKKVLKIKEFTGSLFMRLMLSFAIIIVLSTSFNFLSIAVFRDNIREEVILYNTKNTTNTVNNYEEYIRLALNAAYTLFMNDTTKTFNTDLVNHQKINYSLSAKVNQKIDDWITSNHFLYIHNIFMYYPKQGVVLDKAGTSSLETTFDRFYTSAEYPAEFWDPALLKVSTNQVFPAARFTYNYPDLLSNKIFLPVAVKSAFFNNSYLILLLDAQEAFQKLHDSINDQFYILDQAGKTIFASDSDAITVDPVKMTDKEGYYTKDDYYIFYRKGEASGLNYVNIIPTRSIDAKITRLNMILLLPLFISLIIAVITSVLFSRWFNNPVKKIIEGIHQLEHDPLQSSIKEYQLLQSNIRSMMQTNKEFRVSLERNQSLLKNLAYMNKLRNIHHETKELNFTNKPFFFLLFEVTFLRDIENNYTRAVNFLREAIHQYVVTSYPESMTMQIETHQILSLVFLPEHSQPDLEKVLQGMLDVMELDHDEVFFTISVSEVHANSSELTEAYEQAVQMLNQRKLNHDNQVIWKEIIDQPVFILTPNQEQEFQVHLLAGNTSEVVVWAQRQLASIHKGGNYAVLYQKFLDHLIDRVDRTLHSLNAQCEDLQLMAKQKGNLHSLEQYTEYLEGYLTRATHAVKQRKEEQDHITAFVFNYVENNYMKDISLDLVADKLKITGGYLSTYFKEKTGMNFSDYVNKLRIEKAKQFLEKSNAKVQDVAEKVGYNNVVSFIRVFKKITGQTPGEYKKNIN